MSDALDGMKARLDAAGDEMDRLTAGSPGQNWRWSIPANPQCDTDLILSAPIPDMARLIKAVEAVEKLHVKCEETGKCKECTVAPYSMHSVHWPCPTVSALTAALGGE